MASKITIKRSTTSVPPAGLSFGEMAFVQGTGLTANQLYVGNSFGSPVWVGAQIGTTGSWTDNAAKTTLATQYAIDQRISALISGGSPITTVSDNTNTTRYVVLSTGATTSATLFVDDTTTALSYNPSTAVLTLSGDLNVNGGDISTTETTASLFSSTVTSLGIGLAATAINMGGSTGTFTIKNPALTVGASGLTGTIFADDANLILTTKNYSGGSLDPSDSPAKIIINDNIGQGFVNIEGGDLRLGVKTLSASVSGVDLIFEGTTDNASELTLTAGNPGADYTVTLPHATDTLVGKLTTDTFTNKTYDTAGTGNVFRIAGVTLSGVTGTGSVVLANSPTLVTPNLGTPSTLVGTNITGTATSFTASNVTTNANLTGAITSVGNATSLGSFSSANLISALTDETGSGAAVFGTSPAITTSLTTGSTTFALLNTTATTVNFAGAATALNMGVIGGTATFAGALTVSGNLTVNGTTTTLNSTTLTVDDKNIEMAAIGVPDDATANGGGIIIKGTTDKTILWDSTNSNLTSNQDWNLPTGKVFKINNVSVLSSSALGSGVTGSSLTQVGTITSGTWSGSFGAVSGANLTVLTAGGLTGTIPSGVLGNSSLNIGTTSIALNRTSGSQTLTGVSIDGTAGTATNIVATEQTTGTIFLVGVAAASSSTGLLVNATPATALAYNVATGELSATLIDGGSF
jgi:hypothetical protein